MTTHLELHNKMRSAIHRAHHSYGPRPPPLCCATNITLRHSQSTLNKIAMTKRAKRVPITLAGGSRP
jgi:hypothetical protein